MILRCFSGLGFAPNINNAENFGDSRNGKPMMPYDYRLKKKFPLIRLNLPYLSPFLTLLGLNWVVDHYYYHHR